MQYSRHDSYWSTLFHISKQLLKVKRLSKDKTQQIDELSLVCVHEDISYDLIYEYIIVDKNHQIIKVENRTTNKL